MLRLITEDAKPNLKQLMLPGFERGEPKNVSAEGSQFKLYSGEATWKSSYGWTPQLYVEFRINMLISSKSVDEIVAFMHHIDENYESIIERASSVLWTVAQRHGAVRKPGEKVPREDS
jgi:hypothetical protein